MAGESRGEESQGKRAVLVIFGGIILAIVIFFGVAARLKAEANQGPPAGAAPSFAPPSGAPSSSAP